MATDPSLPPGRPPEHPVPSATEPSPGDKRDLRRSTAIRPRVTAAIAIAAILALVIFLVSCGSSSNSSTTSSGSSARTATPPAVTRAAATAATPASIRALQSQLGHTLYWAGPANGRVLTTQKTSDGIVDLRYLAPGTPLNTSQQQWLSVVTYPASNSFALAQAGGRRPGARTHHLANGGLAVSPPKLTTNVFLSHPGSPVLVEVFDPTPGTALHDVLTGVIRPVG